MDCHYQNRSAVAWLVGLLTLLTHGSLQAAQAESRAIESIGELTRLEVYPRVAEIRGPRSSIQLVVTGYDALGRPRDLTAQATYQLATPEIAKVTDGLVHPLRDGQTTIQIRVNQWEVSCPLSVLQIGESRPVSFQHEVLPALSKQTCNSGACHGAPSGKGGFRLSLRAFDPQLDQMTLRREDYGRRVNPLEPEQSLLLRKPLMRVPHGGGQQLLTTDPAYELLEQWIDQGAPLDAEDTVACVGIEVYPAGNRLFHGAGHQQQLAVRARFADGSQRDITQLAVFTSSDESVAEVNRDGRVQARDRGETTIVVRYLEHIRSTNLTFVHDIPGFEWSAPPENNYVDQHVNAKLKRLQILPAETCTDSEFIRRVYLDVVGLLPTEAELTAFEQDPSVDKRAGLIDQLLERPEYAKFWALKWGDLLRMTKETIGEEGVYKYHRWVERALRQNMPYDQFVRELLTASGSSLVNPAANFYRTAEDTNQCVEIVSQVFLGARFQCAKCHNHPFERWTQDNYYGMAAFFDRVQRSPTQRPAETMIWAKRSGEVVQPRTNQPVAPWVPGVADFESAHADRRQDFVRWLLDSNNPYFARIEVNRIWSQLFHRGIVEPPDDFRDTNPPAIPELLDALAQDFIDSGYDRKHILRRILNSQTYQASYLTHEFNEEDEKYFSHQQPRMLSAEQLLDAISQVTGVPEPMGALPTGTRATQLPAPDLVNHEFLQIFGQPQRDTVCLCERTNDSSLSMAIQFFNGKTLYEKLKNPQSRFRRLLADGQEPPHVVTQLYRLAVSRTPTASELAAAEAYLATKQAEHRDAQAKLESEMTLLQQQVVEVHNATRQRLRREKAETLPEAIREDVLRAVETEPAERDSIQAYLVTRLGATLQVSEKDVEQALTEVQKQQIEQFKQQLTEKKKLLTSPDTALLNAMEDLCWAILNTNEFLFQH